MTVNERVAGLAGLGPVMQMSWLWPDLDEGIAHWTGTMGVGPFHRMDGVALDDLRYDGRPSHATFSVALAYWGDVQIELVAADDDQPSIYSGRYGVIGRIHHLCVLIDDLADARRVCDAAGATVVMEGGVGPDGGVLYVDAGGGPGGLIELLRPAGGTTELFAAIKASGRNWDGRDPVRPIA